MELSGQVAIAAPRERVWAALNDPSLLARCIEGVESLEPAGENRYEGRVSAKVGPVRATFSGAITLSNLDPPNGYTLSGEGKGGAAGFARGSADVALADADGGTVLTYSANALTGGKLAQLGARLIEGTARQMAEKFFAALKAELERPDAAAETLAAEDRGSVEAGVGSEAQTLAAPTPDRPAAELLNPAPPPPEPVRSGGLPMLVWAGGLAVLVLVLIFALS
jgi:carbon monoxide dehydrogenase subunit G